MLQAHGGQNDRDSSSVNAHYAENWMLQEPFKKESVFVEVLRVCVFNFL